MKHAQDELPAIKIYLINLEKFMSKALASETSIFFFTKLPVLWPLHGFETGVKTSTPFSFTCTCLSILPFTINVALMNLDIGYLVKGLDFDGLL